MSSDPIEPSVEPQPTAGPTNSVEPDGLGPFHRRNTPSVGGYVAAAFIALIIGSVLMPLSSGGPRNSSDFFIGFWWVLAIGFFAVLILGLPLTVAAHFTLRNEPRQRVHIATFGGVGMLTGALVGTVFLGSESFPLPVVLAVGVSAATGRALVNRRPR